MQSGGPPTVVYVGRAHISASSDIAACAHHAPMANCWPTARYVGDVCMVACTATANSAEATVCQRPPWSKAQRVYPRLHRYCSRTAPANQVADRLQACSVRCWRVGRNGRALSATHSCLRCFMSTMSNPLRMVASTQSTICRYCAPTAMPSKAHWRTVERRGAIYCLAQRVFPALFYDRYVTCSRNGDANQPL